MGFSFNSFAANPEPKSPYDTASGWCDFLKRIRDTEGVDNVLSEAMNERAAQK